MADGRGGDGARGEGGFAGARHREFFIDNLLVGIHSIIVMIKVDRPGGRGGDGARGESGSAGARPLSSGRDQGAQALLQALPRPRACSG